MKKLNAVGASHIIALMLVIVGAGIVGSYLLVKSKAATACTTASSPMSEPASGPTCPTYYAFPGDFLGRSNSSIVDYSLLIKPSGKASTTAYAYSATKKPVYSTYLTSFVKSYPDQVGNFCLYGKSTVEGTVLNAVLTDVTKTYNPRYIKFTLGTSYSPHCVSATTSNIAVTKSSIELKNNSSNPINVTAIIYTLQ